MKLYHSTTREAALQILRTGFVDGTVIDLVRSGVDYRLVSLLDVPADENEGATSSEACIEVCVPDDVAARHELLVEVLAGDPLLEEPPPGANAFVAEWSIPASVVNEYPRRILADEEMEELGTRRQMHWRTTE